MAWMKVNESAGMMASFVMSIYALPSLMFYQFISCVVLSCS